MAHSPANLETPLGAVPAGRLTDTPADRAAQPNRRDSGGDEPAAAAGPPAAGHPTADRVTVERPAAGKRLGALLRRWGAGSVRWFRDYFAAERVMAFLKSLLIVVPLSVGIWVYAERQQQFTLTNLTLPVEVVSGDPNRFAMIQRPIDGNVVVSLKGPKANVDRLVEQLRAPGAAPIQIQADRTGRGGEQDLTIPSSRIGQDKRFVDAGIVVENAQPESLVVRVEPIVEWDVPIQLPQEQRDQFSNVEFTPPKVKVRGPASVVGDPNDARSQEPKVMVFAELAKRPELQGEPDQEAKFLPNVKVGLSVVNRNVTMTIPPPGSVTARVRPSGTEDFKIDALPTKVVPGPAARGFDWQEVGPLFNVTVTGPREKIDKLRMALPPAYVVLPNRIEVPANATNNTVTVDAEVEYRFEYGITLKSGPRTVPVTLTPR